MDSKTETVSGRTAKKLIANFMGLQFVRVGYTGTDSETKWQRENADWFDRHYDFHDNSVGDYAVNIEKDLIFWQSDLNYYTSWDCIMPVWVKFRDLDFVEDSESDHKHMDWINSLQWYLFSSDEPKRFAERLAYAIKWYNSQSPNTIK